METKHASVDDVLDNLMRGGVTTGREFRVNTQQSSSEDTMGGPTPAKTPLASRPTNGATSGSSGLTMYERSMIQKEERERKMRALQQKLMVDCTFTPSRSGRNSSNHSVVSSIGAGPGSVATADTSVFSRLYQTETAASRGQRYHGGTRSATASGWNTPKSVRSTPGRTFYSTPGGSRSVPSSPRLEELYRFGEERLRSRQLSDEEESRRLHERLEEQELKKRHIYTFQPRTKWNLVAERRRRAQKEAEIAASEARRSTPKMMTDEQEHRKTMQEETELEECTFTPKTSWNLAEERRKKAVLSPSVNSQYVLFTPRSQRERMERDRRYEEEELKECTFSPKTNWSSSRSVPGSMKMTVPSEVSEDEFVDLKRPVQDTKRLQTPIVPEPEVIKVKLVSSDSFQEESGRNSKPPAVVRHNMVREIVTPKTPEWKKKHRKIGQKTDLESRLEAQGQGAIDSRKRGHTVIRSPGLDVQERTETVPAQALYDTVNNTAQMPSVSPLDDDEKNDVKVYTPPENFAPSVDPAHVQQQKTLAEQALKVRLEQKRCSKLEAGLEHQERRHEQAAKVLMEVTQQPPDEPWQEHLEENHESIAREQKVDSLVMQQVEATNPLMEQLPPAEAKSKAKKWYDRMMKRGKKTDSTNTPDNPTAEQATKLEQEEKLRVENKAKAAEAKRLADEARVAKKAAVEQARLEAEEAKTLAEEVARVKAEEEESLAAEAMAVEEATEAKRLAEELERLQAEEVAAEEHARLAAEEEAMVNFQEERLAAREQARLEAKEAKMLAEQIARVKAEEEKSLAVEARAAEEAAKAQSLAEEQQRLQAEEDTKVSEALAEEHARLAAEEARVKVEEERLAAKAAAAAAAEEATGLAEEKERHTKEERKLAAEEAAAAEEAKNLAEEQEGLQAEEDARVFEAKSLAEAEERLAAEATAVATPETKRLAEDDAKLKDEAKAAAGSDLLAEEVILTKSAQAEPALSTVGADRNEASDAKKELYTSSEDEVDGILESLSMDGSTDEDDALVAQVQVAKPKMKVKSDRARKWKDRLSKKKGKSKQSSDAASDTAIAGTESANAYPQILYDDGDSHDSKKLPEIGSI